MGKISNILIFLITPICVGLISARILHLFVPIFFYVCFLSSIFTLTFSLLLARYASLLTKDSKNVAGNQSIFYSLTTALIIFSFLATVPLNLDRSFSVWMLNKTIESERAPSIEELENKASQFFAPSGGEIKRRINEQILLGNLKVLQNQVELTDRGKITWRINRLISDFFGLNKKYTG